MAVAEGIGSDVGREALQNRVKTLALLRDGRRENRAGQRLGHRPEHRTVRELRQV